MKPNRLSIAPTRNRRLNEMLGIIVLVAAGVLLLSLLTYTPSDPSLNSAATSAVARNWIGSFGAYLSDILLQSLGIAVLFLPIVLVSIGVSWVRSRPVGSTMSRACGLILWLVFAPATIALLPFSLRYKHAIPISGVEGRLLSDALVRSLNLPGTAILCSLMVLLSLYLATSFTLSTASDWFGSHFGFLSSIATRRQRHKEANTDGRFDTFEPTPSVPSVAVEPAAFSAGSAAASRRTKRRSKQQKPRQPQRHPCGSPCPARTSTPLAPRAFTLPPQQPRRTQRSWRTQPCR
jgi:S-DNA-T family DNA segregation ATPase FtsK/SpoIIIE